MISIFSTCNVQRATCNLFVVACSLLLVTVVVSGCGTTPRQTGRLPAPPAGGETDGAPLQQVDFDSIPEPEPQMEPYSKYGNPPYYEVNGRLYHTLSNSAGYVERGIASWYGTKFHGRRTSSGEPYDLYGVTAAHKTLPLPSYVLVTNLNNGRNLVVRVNDRGPFHEERLIDLSYAAAGKLGVLPTGTALVEVRAIQPGEPLPTLVARVGESPPYEIPVEPDQAPVPLVASADSQPPVGIEAEASPIKEEVKEISPPAPMPVPVSKPADRIYLQVGAFKSRANAEQLRNRIATRVRTAVEIINTATWYRVRLGPMLNSAEAAEATTSLSKLGLGTPQRVNQ
ncbi:MAG: septal ring lytic transglycosylase RlpA family protein [Gammaproteobacteria bacterium]|nr:septal ring lytic transglycosylase RlpA family protein [Gammaproteobacteria bacterium]